MNWFKKKFSRLFDEKIDEYDDEIQFEETEIAPETKSLEHKRSSFRFPIIDDDEIELKRPSQNEHDSTFDSNSQYQNQRATHVVYDVEVSGLRELLEQRRNGKGKSVRKHTALNVELKQTIKPKSNVNNSNRYPISKQIEKKSEEIQVASRKRFTPSQVPSPVHGFRKPSPINQLLKGKTEQNIAMDIENELPLPNKEILNTELASNEIASTVQLKSDLDIDKVQKNEEDLIVNSFPNSEIQTSSIQLEQQENVHDTEIEILSGTGMRDADSVVENDVISYNQIVQKLADEINFNNKLYQFEEDFVDHDQKFDDSIEYDNLNHSYVVIEHDVKESEENQELPVTEESESESEELSDLPISKQSVVPIYEELERFVEVNEVDFEDPIDSIDPQEKIDDYDNVEKEDRQNQVGQLDGEPNEVVEEAIFSPHLNNVEDKQIIHKPDIENNKISSGSKLPFNVLMLKSDKEKLKLKEAILKANSPSEVKHITIANSESVKPLSEKNELLPEEELLDTTQNVLEYAKPTFDCLIPPEEKTEDREWMESQANNLVESLSYFQVTAQVESIVQGPAVTQFEITVGHGTKVSKIKNLADDLKLALAAKDIRIQAPIPGKSSIGIEIPNRISRAVRLSEVVRSATFETSDSPLEAALGLDLTGKPITIDLRKMPHGLIAGATGSGKSVCINSILVSLLYKADPHELKLMLIDPKVVELAPFNNIPHLVSPVITDVKTATAALKWAVEEMERRYQLFAHVGVRDLSRYNKQAEKNGNKNKLPYILIVIDELADLMMMAPSDVEESIARIAQKARACGIHLIVATQRPSVDVITGLIKSNIPTRIAFAVSSQIDSRTILDSQGAERLLGRGDMLYLGNGMSAPIRIQGTFVTDDEIEEIIEHVRSQGKPNYMFEHEELLKKSEIVEEYDELFEEVCRFVYEQGTASTSSIQRNYKVGYNRAARLMDLLEKNGYISEQRGSKPREVYITESDIHSMFDQ